MTFNSDSSILVTGGTGSFGKAFIAEVLTRFLLYTDWLFTVVMS